MKNQPTTAEEIRQQMNTDKTDRSKSVSEDKGQLNGGGPSDTDSSHDEKGEEGGYELPEGITVFTPDCEQCDDTGVLQKATAFQNPEFCDCEEGEAKQEDYEKKLWERLRIPRDYREDNLKTFRTEGVTQSIRDAYQVVSVYIQKLEYGLNEGMGLYLYGDNGTGKTHLLISVLKEAGRTLSFRARPIYMEATKLIRAHKPDSRRVFSDDVDPYEEPYETPLLFLDEIDDIQGTRHDFQILQDVIKSRYNQNRATLIASNEKPEELESNVAIETVNLNGITSRLTEMCKMVDVQGEDKRPEFE